MIVFSAAIKIRWLKFLIKIIIDICYYNCLLLIYNSKCPSIRLLARIRGKSNFLICYSMAENCVKIPYIACQYGPYLLVSSFIQ